ncbi:MAG: usg protein [Alphaproteobacteria bacterium]|nr:usg protein [Alphaproteobacteria bacterium]
MRSLELQLHGYRLTTAEIIYRMPDHPGVLQSFIWQNLDLAPRFPVLHKFLEFWEKNIEGKLYKIIVANTRLITPGELRAGSMTTLQ